MLSIKVIVFIILPFIVSAQTTIHSDVADMVVDKVVKKTKEGYRRVWVTENPHDASVADIIEEKIIRYKPNIVKLPYAPPTTPEEIDANLKAYREAAKIAYKDYSYTRTLYEIDCAGDRLRTISERDYDTEGNSIHATNITTLWLNIDPKSVGGDFQRLVCK